MAELHHLAAGGVSLVLDATGPGLPSVLHWGAPLGEPTADDLAALRLAAVAAVVPSALDEPWPFTLLPGESDGWLGRPGLQAARSGRALHPRWREVRVTRGQVEPAATRGATDDVRSAGQSAEWAPSAPASLVVDAIDPDAGLDLRSELVLTDSGVLTVRQRLTNTGPGTLAVTALLTLLPLPSPVAETLDLTGRWCRERSPQRARLHQGGRVRECRRGRTGHDATGVLVAGTTGFGFRTGELWAVHVAWSGDHVHLVERPPEGAGVDTGALGGGELLRTGEVRLDPGESHTPPEVLFAWSDAGLDGLSARWHHHVRARPEQPRSPRPLTLNVWEAVYFDHDLARLTALADRAAAIGVERIVLDDGWFAGRRDDTAGLGDWTVDPDVWPAGLHPFLDHVRALGLAVGLWVEPEMVSPDSELARAHPDWLLAPAGGTRGWRQQQLLDLTRPEPFDYLLTRLDALVEEYALDHLKWDHNRDLHEAVSTAAGGAVPTPAVHAQTRALYRLLDELRERHPRLEIESCASGGARVDLGILARTARVWPSDCNDPVERQAIQRWTGLLLPPELIGSHIGPPVAHTTGRSSTLAFRALTALFGHAGIEWDLTTCSAADLVRLRHWADRYRRLRPLLHGGRTVRTDERDGAWLHGVVADDRRAACYAWVRLATGADARPGRVRLPGLDPLRRYRVQAVDVLGPAGVPAPVGVAVRRPPAWYPAGVELPGAALGAVGVALAPLDPGTGVLLELTALD